MREYNKELLKLKVTSPDNGGDEITCGIKDVAYNKPKYKDNVNCFMDQLQSSEDYKSDELKILKVLNDFLPRDDINLTDEFWPLGTETHGKNQFEILKTQGVIPTDNEWNRLSEDQQREYNRKLDYCLLTREAEDLITQLYNYYLLNGIKLNIDLSTGNQVEEGGIEVIGFIQYIFQTIDNIFDEKQIYQNEEISKLFFKTVLIPFVEKYYETPENVFSILSRNQQLTDITVTPGRFYGATVSEEELHGVLYNSERQTPQRNEQSDIRGSFQLMDYHRRYPDTSWQKMNTVIKRDIIGIRKYNNPNLYYSSELKQEAERILPDTTIDSISDESLKDSIKADKISYLPTALRSKYRLTLHNERVGELVSSIITFTSLLQTRYQAEYDSMKSLTDNIVKVTDKYRNIIELYRMECSSVCLSDEFKRTLLLLKAGVPKLKLNPLYWREFANIEMASSRGFKYSMRPKLEDIVKIANGEKIRVAENNFSVNTVKTLGLTDEEIFHIKYWMYKYNEEKTYALNDLGFTEEQKTRVDTIDGADRQQIVDETEREQDRQMRRFGEGRYRGVGGARRVPWFFTINADDGTINPDDKNFELNKTYNPQQTFDNIKNYNVGVDNVLKRKSPFTNREIKSAVRQQPFTWEGPRKSDVRSYSGNSLVAGPFWPVDLYEIIDHHFYKPFFEENNTNNIINVKTPVYCDYNICRPVIKKTQGIQVVSKFSADNECLQKNNTTKELASMWYDTADHYPIIGTYLFTEDAGVKQQMNAFKTNFLDKPENQYINQNSEDVTCDRRERNLSNNIIMKEFYQNWNVTSSGLFGLYGTSNSLQQNIRESKYHEWYTKRNDDMSQEPQDIKNINTMATIVDDNMSKLLTDSPDSGFWISNFSSGNANVNRGGNKKTKKMLKRKTRKRKNKKTNKRTNKKTNKRTRKRKRRRKSNKKRS